MADPLALLLQSRGIHARAALASLPRPAPGGPGWDLIGGESERPLRFVNLPGLVDPALLLWNDPVVGPYTRHWQANGGGEIGVYPIWASARHFAPQVPTRWDDPFVKIGLQEVTDAARDDFVRQQEALRERTRRARVPAWRQVDRRARKLVRRVLTRAQWRTYRRHGYVDLRGGVTHRPYRVWRGSVQNVRLLGMGGVELCRYCAAPYDLVPLDDVVAGQVLALQYDEVGFLLTALRII